MAGSPHRSHASSGSSTPFPRPAAAAAYVLSLLLSAAGALAQIADASPGPLEVPRSVAARDRGSDGGGAIVVSWNEPPGSAARVSAFRIERTSSPDSGFAVIGEAPAGVETFVDQKAPVGVPFSYRVVAVSPAGEEADSERTMPVASRTNWFRSDRTNALVLITLFTSLVLFFIGRARRGANLFIRRIAGLSAIDEAIGRATEMGRKIFYVPGIMSMDEIQTIASLAILGYVSKLSATYGADLDVPNKDPLTYAAARETVKHAYLESGRPDLFREEIVNYVTYDQFAYTAVVTGRMVREKPAANFFIGSFYAESLILSETGQSTGAIQIAGTAEVFQLPFFVATCDYTLIGEELYAASAYLSHEPVLLGSIKGQDMMKAVLLVLGAVGVILMTAGIPVVADWFTMH